MLRRLIRYSPSLSKQKWWTAPSASYCDKQKAIARKFKAEREKAAEDFIANLDEAGLEKMKEIKELHSILKNESTLVPETIPITSWQVLITEHNSYFARVKYFRKLFLDECTKKNEKEKKERKRKEREKRLTELEEKGEMYIPQFSINYAERDNWSQKWCKVRALRSDIDVIIDSDIDQRDREYVNTCSQIQDIFGRNSTNVQPLNIHLTSIHRNRHLDQHVKHSKLLAAHIHQEHFSEIFDRSKLVYLSPDGPPMNKFDTQCTYIIGGSVDLQSKKQYTLGISRQLGIRSASLPIRTHCDLRQYQRRTVLTLDKVFGILLDMYQHGCWERAFKNNLGYKYPLYRDITYEGFQDQIKLFSEKKMARNYERKRRDLS